MVQLRRFRFVSCSNWILQILFSNWFLIYRLIQIPMDALPGTTPSSSLECPICLDQNSSRSLLVLSLLVLVWLFFPVWLLRKWQKIIRSSNFVLTAKDCVWLQEVWLISWCPISLPCRFMFDCTLPFYLWSTDHSIRDKYPYRILVLLSRIHVCYFLTVFIIWN